MPTTTYETTTDKAAQIRAELKKRYGWTSRDVSIRADYYSMGSSIDVRIKNPAVKLAQVKAIAEQAERIHRCEISGEILGGGNRFVSVRYTPEAIGALAAPHDKAVQDAVDQLRAATSDNLLMPISGTDFLVGWGNCGRGNGFKIWDKNGYRADAYDQASIAEYVGVGSWNQ